MKLRFNPYFFASFILVFAIEFYIAVYVKDNLIRPFFGDVLVVILLYFFIRTVTCFKHQTVIIGVLFFAYFIEFSQYLNLITLLHLQDIKIARIIIGTTYDSMDLVAYTFGAFILYSPLIFKKLFNFNNKVLFLIGLINLIMASSFAMVDFIPHWEIIAFIIILIFFSVTVFSWFILLIHLWYYKIHWIKFGLFSMALSTITILLFLISILSTGQGFLGPDLIMELTLKEQHLYIYRDQFFPPNNPCQSPYYQPVLIYIKNAYLPMMHLQEIDFQIGNIEMVHNQLVITALCEDKTLYF